MNKSLPEYSYKDYLLANKDGLSRFDYFYRVRTSLGLHDDVAMSVVALFNPTLFVHEGGYFVKENFTQDRYDQTVAQGIAPLEIPGWLNMVEITSLLGDIGYDEAAELGAVIRDCWNKKLDRQFPGSGFEARLVLEDDLDEVWVTLCKQ
ncbi:hypothetical protein CU666_01760 [Pseudomonas syringae pv. actinidifoliorum]|uniref:hypothetical protein n=1 Tax=Pseudomonas syringae TaxID=317 RepID=UPI001372BCE8|nr:hypothetical protein [Pseudomonas syringae]NAS96643.1 hypothetical protein [Pseudomonas syringae pv. actinidifoliorum]NAT16124.1 hypothetical protein [Pseudomonas syringae pv. actinidifoliorum]NAT57234.1 hypothetical protein [Pseudomonas syringae pv. actinidifoliorum]NAT66866.1 hypothetical protein [Pseudomonas syringae pv. actinidifoliorum]